MRGFAHDDPATATDLRECGRLLVDYPHVRL